MLPIIAHVAEQQVGDQIDLDQIRPVAHKPQGIGIGDQVDTVTDPIGSEQQGVAHMPVGFIDLSRVNGEPHAVMPTAQLAQGRQKAQRIALVVVLAPDHVDRDKEVAVARDELVEGLQTLLGIGQKAHNGHLQAQRHAAGQRIVPRQTGAIDVRDFIGGEGRALGGDEPGYADHALQIRGALSREALHVQHQRIRGDVGIGIQVPHTLPVGLEELVAALVGLVQAQAVEPGRFLRCIESVQRPILTALAAA